MAFDGEEKDTSNQLARSSAHLLRLLDTTALILDKKPNSWLTRSEVEVQAQYSRLGHFM
jgi:hypothetical protein